mmetsp:Transcript_9746/g.25929  ORF Transcript_9746/g.25929 Transcript_9746/m.25929 type:complete len:404 (-) Transcript_9746:162-1373(-)
MVRAGEVTVAPLVLAVLGENVLVSDWLLSTVTSGFVLVKVPLVSKYVIVADTPGADCDCVLRSEVVPTMVNWPNAVVVPVVVPAVVPMTVAAADSVCGAMSETVLLTTWLVVDLVYVSNSGTAELPETLVLDVEVVVIEWLVSVKDTSRTTQDQGDWYSGGSSGLTSPGVHSRRHWAQKGSFWKHAKPWLAQQREAWQPSHAPEQGVGPGAAVGAAVGGAGGRAPGPWTAQLQGVWNSRGSSGLISPGAHSCRHIDQYASFAKQVKPSSAQHRDSWQLSQAPVAHAVEFPGACAVVLGAGVGGQPPGPSGPKAARTCSTNSGGQSTVRYVTAEGRPDLQPQDVKSLQPGWKTGGSSSHRCSKWLRSQGHEVHRSHQEPRGTLCLWLAKPVPGCPHMLDEELER